MTQTTFNKPLFQSRPNGFLEAGVQTILSDILWSYEDHLRYSANEDVQADLVVQLEKLEQEIEKKGLAVELQTILHRKGWRTRGS